MTQVTVGIGPIGKDNPADRARPAAMRLPEGIRGMRGLEGDERPAVSDTTSRRFIRWGHLDTFSPNRTFAFMVSLRTARALQDRLREGERIRLHAEAGQHPGFYEVVTASIEGSDPTGPFQRRW